MAIDHQSASASLKDIEAVAQRTREVLHYGGASTSLILWGVLVAIGYVVQHFDIDFAKTLWTVILIGGMAGTIVIHGVLRRSRTYARERRLLYAMVVLAAFGAFWATLIGAGHGRELGAFWPTLFMLGYVIGGLWLGRFFIVCGVAVTLGTIAVYYWSGPWFCLWMAAINGLGLISGGLWLRKAGSTT